MQLTTCPIAPLAAIAILLLAGTPLAQCEDWPDGCPTAEDLGVADADNTPIATSPGHTVEEFCPVEVNPTFQQQLDLTDTFITIDQDDLLYLRSFYNSLSAATTTDQFWFFDADNDPLTGGGDGVQPTYIDAGVPSDQGPAPCGMPGCSLEHLETVHASGFEFYIHSYGASFDDFALFYWDGVEWVEDVQPIGAINLQAAEDDPLNPYPGNNGYRGIAYLPKELLGITDGYFRVFARSWSCIECCGDRAGGEGIVLQPGMRPCETSQCGDCDGDGFVNVLDALRAARADSGLATLSDQEFSNCNVAGTTGPSFTATVSILDALTIARYVVGLETLRCCVCCVP
jgi:hypothetical protein